MQWVLGNPTDCRASAAAFTATAQAVADAHGALRKLGDWHTQGVWSGQAAERAHDELTSLVARLTLLEHRARTIGTHLTHAASDIDRAVHRATAILAGSAATATLVNGSTLTTLTTTPHTAATAVDRVAAHLDTAVSTRLRHTPDPVAPARSLPAPATAMTSGATAGQRHRAGTTPVTGPIAGVLGTAAATGSSGGHADAITHATRPHTTRSSHAGTTRHVTPPAHGTSPHGINGHTTTPGHAGASKHGSADPAGTHHTVMPTASGAAAAPITAPPVTAGQAGMGDPRAGNDLPRPLSPAGAALASVPAAVPLSSRVPVTSQPTGASPGPSRDTAAGSSKQPAMTHPTLPADRVRAGELSPQTVPPPPGSEPGRTPAAPTGTVPAAPAPHPPTTSHVSVPPVAAIKLEPGAAGVLGATMAAGLAATALSGNLLLPSTAAPRRARDDDTDTRDARGNGRFAFDTGRDTNADAVPSRQRMDQHEPAGRR